MSRRRSSVAIPEEVVQLAGGTTRLGPDNDDNSGGGVMLTDNLVKHATGQFDISVIQRLKLNYMNICTPVAGDLPPPFKLLQPCIQLTVLDLSHNRITRLDGLCAPDSPLADCLLSLNLSHNRLAKVDIIGPAGFKKLEVLKLDNNKIADVDTLGNLAQFGKQMRCFTIHSNPVSAPPEGAAGGRRASGDVPATKGKQPWQLREQIKKWFPNLRSLDGDYLLFKRDRAGAADPAADEVAESLMRRVVRGINNSTFDDAELDCDDDEEELTLPPSQPWVAKEYFSTNHLVDPTKVCAAEEKKFKAAASETRRMMDVQW